MFSTAFGLKLMLDFKQMVYFKEMAEFAAVF